MPQAYVTAAGSSGDTGTTLQQEHFRQSDLEAECFSCWPDSLAGFLAQQASTAFCPALALGLSRHSSKTQRPAA